MKLFIANGLIVDPTTGYHGTGDILIDNGIIEKIVRREDNIPTDLLQVEDCKVIDATGKWVVPGLIDLHVHFREPGFEYKEDVVSGSKSAARGGVTTVCCMPNTNPVIDTSDVVSLIDEKAFTGSGIHVFCVAAITKGQAGKELVSYEELMNTPSCSKELLGSGICGISEDGKTVTDQDVMESAMKEAAALGLTVYSHAEPESEIVARDIALSEKTGCKVHFCHISEKKSVELIRQGKKRGANITAETAPHYLVHTCEDVKGDTNKKMNPPLQSEEDQISLIEGLMDGTIDAIATDHAPHHEGEKLKPYQEAPNGVVGLETSFAACYTALVKTGKLSALELIEKMSTKPAEILGYSNYGILEGAVGDVAVIDIERSYKVDPSQFVSKGKNSPFIGEILFGQVACTIVNGRIVYEV